MTAARGATGAYGATASVLEQPISAGEEPSEGQTAEVLPTGKACAEAGSAMTEMEAWNYRDANLILHAYALPCSLVGWCIVGLLMVP